MMTNISFSAHLRKSTSIKINETFNFKSRICVYFNPLYEHVKGEDMLTFCSIEKKLFEINFRVTLKFMAYYSQHVWSSGC
jgi:hypothetical protein